MTHRVPIRYNSEGWFLLMPPKTKPLESAEMGEFAVGQSVPREEDPRLLTGAGEFLDDINLRGQAWGYVLRSPHAMADIDSIDIEEAEAAPGVLRILIGKDWAAENYGGLPCEDATKKRPDGSPMYHPTWPALADGRTRLVGDGVALSLIHI